MGQPVVHFEIVGQDAERLQAYYSELFGWEIDTDNPLKYGVVAREDNVSADGIGIGGGIAAGPEGYSGHVTFYIAVPDAEAALAKAERLGGQRGHGPGGGDGPAHNRPVHRSRGPPGRYRPVRLVAAPRCAACGRPTAWRTSTGLYDRPQNVYGRH